MIDGMTTERVTISLPAPLRSAVQRIAEESGTPFSAVVSSALEAWVRGRLVDVWLADYQAEHGAFDEAELQRVAADAGVRYVPPPSGEVST